MERVTNDINRFSMCHGETGLKSSDLGELKKAFLHLIHNQTAHMIKEKAIQEVKNQGDSRAIYQLVKTPSFTFYPRIFVTSGHCFQTFF